MNGQHAETRDDVPRPREEARRLEALRSYDILGTPPEDAFDDIARIAAEITDTPTALVNLIDAERQWSKARVGFAEPEIPRAHAVCSHTILGSGVMVVKDLHADERFADSPIVTADPFFRFYAGAPITTEHGLALGALCVLDTRPRDLTASQRDALSALSRQVMKEIDLRRNLRDMASTISGRRRTESPEILQAILDRAPAMVYVKDQAGRFLLVNGEFERVTGLCRDDVVGQTDFELFEDGPADDRHAEDKRVVATGEAIEREEVVLHDGRPHVHLSLRFPLSDSAGDPYAVCGISMDVTALKAAEEQLRFVADHDPVTGLLNRSGFEREVVRELTRAARYHGDCALVILDLDGFKAVNDALGHAAGDAVVTSVAGLLRSRVRETDVLGRLGGDEFAVLLPNADADRAAVVGDELAAAIRDHVAVVAGHPVRLTASIGVAAADGLESTGDALLAAADSAMYDAKEAGRDRVARWRPGSSAPTRSRLTWTTRLRRALAEDRFVLHLQPIVDLASGEAVQHEVLLRMVEPDGTLVAPAAFLGPAERLGLIGDIDRWVVTHAIALLAREHEQGRVRRFEVNLSGRSLDDVGLPRVVEEALGDSGVDPSCLTFEVTETAAIANVASARSFAERLARLGCRFALDDFGTGFGSFFYLKHLPVDVLKIDGDFVRDLPGSSVDLAVVESVVHVARSLGKQTIAEYVETEAAARLLREAGVDRGQGYLFGRPVDAAAALEPAASASEG